MKKYIQKLQQLGLSANEAKVYVAGLSEAVGVTTLARRAGLYRHQVYEPVATLHEKGLLVQKPSGKRVLYQAASPEVLERYTAGIQEQSKQLAVELLEHYQAHANKPTIEFYEGVSGLQHVLLDIPRTIQKGEVYYRYSSGKNRAAKEYKKFRPKEYYRLRDDEKHLERFVITSSEDREHHIELLERMVRVVPKEFSLFPHDVAFSIYADKVSVVDYTTQTAFIVESETFANFQRNLFKMQFKLLGDLPENQKLQ